MKLSHRFLLVFLGAFILFLCLAYGVQRYFVFTSFLEIEQAHACNEMGLCIGAIEREGLQLERLVSDWAVWDDTYEFIQDRNEDYIESNLNEETFLSTDVNLIYFVDTAGEVAWGMAYSLEDEQEVKLASFPQTKWPLDSMLLAGGMDAGFRSGIVCTERGPMMIAWGRILTSERTGPPRGTAVFGRFLTDEHLEAISQKPNDAFSCKPLDRKPSSEEERRVSARAVGEGPLILEGAAKEPLRVYATYPDVEGKPALLLRLLAPRDISTTGAAAMRLSLIMLCISGIVILSLLSNRLQQMVIKPLAALSGQISAISNSENLSVRLGMTRQDEIGALAREFDAMLDRLETDIEERKKAEAALQQSEERYRTLFECSHDAIMTLEPPEWQFASCNSACVAMFGAKDKAELTTYGPGELSPERQPNGRLSSELIAEMNEIALREGSHFFEWSHNRLNGEEFPATVLLTRVELDGYVFLQATTRDISRQKQMEMELTQALKLEAVGRLAAGIAHEINTPTQYVGDNIEFMQSACEALVEFLQTLSRIVEAGQKGEVPRELMAEAAGLIEHAQLDFLLDEIPKALEQSLEGVSRIATIVQAMKEFSHPGVAEKTPVDLNQCIRSTATVSRNEWKYVADLEFDLDETLPQVMCLPGDFNQTILNIIVNAAHAIEDVQGGGESEKGKIVIGTRQDGEWAEIRIADTGGGIPEAIRERIFDPFFTTKEVGRGTGQGLAIARNVIADKHGGTIKMESEPGEGTVFIIRLPVNGQAQ